MLEIIINNILESSVKNVVLKEDELSVELKNIFDFYGAKTDSGYYIITKEMVNEIQTDLKNQYVNQTKSDLERTKKIAERARS